MKTYIYILLLLLFCSTQIKAQQLVAYEWFVDTDPGIGNATLVSTTNSDQLNIVETFPSSGLALGMHQFGIRWKDDTGVWSHTLYSQFFIESTSDDDLESLEWYQNDDPGVGQGNAIAASDQNQIDQIESLTLTGQIGQLSNVRLRLKTSGGTWGHSLTTYFNYENQSLKQITGIEVQKDTMSGTSIGAMYANSGESIDVVETLSGYTNEAGYNGINLRPRDSYGVPGHFLSTAFVVEKTPAPITTIQYDYDTTLMRRITNLPESVDSLSLNELYELSTTDLLLGIHKMQVRLQDASGVVSHHWRDSIDICIPDSSITNTAICQGDSIFLAGAWQTEAGSYFETTVATSGCDSIIETVLSLIDKFEVSKTASTCSGDSIFLENAWQTSSGVYYDTLTTTAGCDSIIETTLSILPLYTSSQTISLCNGDSIFLADAWQTTEGNYEDIYQSSNGCDSTVTTTLTVNLNSTVQLNETICEGDSILLSGEWQNQAGNYTDTLSSANGCDSLITTTLTVLETITNQVSETICNGDSIQINGAWYSEAQVVEQVFTGQTGCDSIVKTQLLINPLPNVEAMTSNTSICLNDSVTLSATGALNYTWEHGGTNSIHVTPTSSGEHTYTVTGVDEFSCQNSDSIIITVLDLPIPPSVTGDTNFCSNTNPKTFMATGTNINWYYDQSLGALLHIGNELEISTIVGAHTLYVTEIVGACESEATEFNYTVLAAPGIDLDAWVEITSGEPYQINPVVTNGSSFSWMPSNGLDDATIAKPIALIDSTRTYTLTVTNDDGCVASESILIRVNGLQLDVFISNFISPNNDGKNDTWFIEPIEAFVGCNITIVDVNGSEVFQTANYLNNWDGTYEGNLLPDGNYFYVISCAEDQFVGAITLLNKP